MSSGKEGDAGRALRRGTVLKEGDEAIEHDIDMGRGAGASDRIAGGSGAGEGELETIEAIVKTVESVAVDERVLLMKALAEGALAVGVGSIGARACHGKVS